MEVILLERIEKLGQMGDLVKVKPGFARNFLLPQKKAVTATADNKKHFESQRTQLEAKNIELKKEAEKISKKLSGIRIVVVRQAGDTGQLYGSVNARDIANGLTDAGISVDRRQIKLENPIKTVGIHPVKVSVHPEVNISISVNVARSEEEAEIQDRTGTAIIASENEIDAVEELVEKLDTEEPNMPSESEAEDQAKASIENNTEQDSENSELNKKEGVEDLVKAKKEN